MATAGYGRREESRSGRLVAAVQARDADVVRALLEEGADPDTVGEDGLPVLCVAVAAYDEPVAEALVQGGADQYRSLPDGTTPLLRAVDLGSPAMVLALLLDEPQRRIPHGMQEQLLALAGQWYETGAAEELRRRSGVPGPAAVLLVPDGESNQIEQISLGGLTVRAGHGAILTWLERAFHISTPVDELAARALRYPEEEDADSHGDWFAACFTLSERRDKDTWAAVEALRHHPSPAHRGFLAAALGIGAVFVGRPGLDWYSDAYHQLLAAWAADETDGRVLAKVLSVCPGHHGGPDNEALGLRYADHPDPRVRSEVPYYLHTRGVGLTPAATTALLSLARDPEADVRAAVCEVLGGARDLTSETRNALLALVRDPDAGVRATAAGALSGSGDRAPAVADAFVRLLDEDDQLLRLEGAYGLAKLDDPRTGAASERVGPLGPGFEHDHRAGELWYWTWRNRPDRA
ncbi:HEAT repeat domain-containing protein [Kitasatospora indigofera]|uniref:HEAT repeat domain-containing protein n=1 Tax=Kitasatospora indigofera TaxID=67307 RepID=UPI0033ABA9EB